MHNLGVLLESQILLDEQVAKRSFAQLCVGCKLHMFLDHRALLMVTHVLVTTWLDYYNALQMCGP